MKVRNYLCCMLGNTGNNTKYNHRGSFSSTRQVTGTDLAVTDFIQN